MEEYGLKPHRYRELKHFCLQYLDMKAELESIVERDGYLIRHHDPTSALAIREAELKNALKLIETTAYDTERFLGDKVLKMVTEDVNPKGLTMPIVRECMEELRRRFYFLLDKRKGV